MAITYLHSKNLTQTPHRPFTRTIMRQQRKRLEGHNTRCAEDFIAAFAVRARGLGDHLAGGGCVAVPDTRNVSERGEV